MPAGSPGPEVTPGRNTKVRFNRFFPAVSQRPVVFERRASEIARGSQTQNPNIVYIAGIGLQIRAHQLDPSNLFERSIAQGKILQGGSLAVVASNTTIEYVNRQYDYPDLNYTDADPSYLPMYQKKIPAGASWEQRLSADQSAFPSPDTASDPIGMDRMFISTQDHKPDKSLHLALITPGRPGKNGALSTIMFTGPPGTNSAGAGVGQYGLKLMLDGLANLFERCKTGGDGSGRAWVKRTAFPWAIDPEPRSLQYLSIFSDATESCGSRWTGSTLTFVTAGSSVLPTMAVQGGNKLIGSLAGLSQMLISREQRTYRVPGDDPEASPELQPVRLDLRRDTRALFTVSESSYNEEESILDDPFEIPVFPTSHAPFTVEWYGDFPAGTYARCRMFFAATALEIPDGDLLISDCLGGVIEYPVTSDMLFTRAYQVQITLYSDGDATPTLRRYRVIRDGVILDVDVDQIVFPTARAAGVAVGRQEIVDEVDADGEGEDPTADTATIHVADFTNEMPELETKVGTPLDVEIYDDSNVLVTRLARIYIAKNTSHQIRGERFGNAGAISGQYPKPGSRHYSFTGQGEFTRLKRSLFPEKFWLSEIQDGSETGATTKAIPMKVTDALAKAINFAGYDMATMIDVPDLPIRFWSDGGGDDDGLLVDAYSNIGDFVIENARDFLAAWPVFDLNAGTGGMWRIFQQKRPPYNNLMRFVRDHPGAGKVPHSLLSYPIDTGNGSNGAVTGQLIPYNFITNEERSVEPPEGNCVICHGGYTNTSSSQSPTLLSQFVFNPVSFNPMGLASSHANYPDPTSPDFLGDCVPIVVMDGTLNNRSAVDWVTRRVFDFACFAREYLAFDAPLRYIWDVTDDLQTYARKLRFGDPVQVLQADATWRQYLVVRCSPNYSQDGIQMARYELVTSSVITQYGMPIGAFDLFKLEEMRKRRFRASVGAWGRTSFLRTKNRELLSNRSEIIAWPATKGPGPIQDVDPESATFGAFLYMPDYDPVP